MIIQESDLPDPCDDSKIAYGSEVSVDGSEERKSSYSKYRKVGLNQDDQLNWRKTTMFMAKENSGKNTKVRLCTNQ